MANTKRSFPGVLCRQRRKYIISATVDTGSEAEIVASAAIVLLLQLNYIEPIDVKQVDDEYASALLFEGEMNWQGVRQSVKVICMGESVLIGMGLMRGHHLSIDVQPNGLVQIV